MVIAVILILAGITFGISRGVQNSQARAKAKAELAIIAQGLEQFKATYGDYPWSDDFEDDSSSFMLIKSLLGWKEFDTSGAEPAFKDKSSVPSSGPKEYVDISKLTVYPASSIPKDSTNKPSDPDLALIDPWGNEYVYKYKETNSWDNFGYILYSKGPDSAATDVGSDGVQTNAIREQVNNADNIYVGE